ncbi:glycoside hydrolase family 5 protein [Nonomuraea sp. NBC_01738]|uniref:hypothetical protein n=1 Tax=Nonomuraea sp. NBC_01738 TaxID=2976003 RepID=UPI002E147A10|nr:glycoside hydrolase family 5 protein [Nonomuraea sp. NBC_01738]
MKRLLVALLLLAATSLTATAGVFTLVVSSPSLVFHVGQGPIRIGSTAASISYRIADEKNTTVRTGVRWMASGASTVAIDDLGPGYYTLSMHAGAAPNPTDLTTSFAVIEPVPVMGEEAPYGAAVHIGRAGWPLSVLDDARKAGISHIREDAYWNTFETTKGAYTFPAAYTAEIERAQALGLTPLLIANGASGFYDNGRTPSSPEGIAAFGRFADALMTRYGLRNVEVLNEYNARTFNTSVCGTTPACYLDVLKGVAAAVGPEVNVVGPATIGIGNCAGCFAPTLVGLGGLGHADAYSVHPYHYPGGPEWMGGNGDTIAGLRQTVGGAPVYLSEMGWPTDTGHGTTELQQADNLVRLYTVAGANGVTRIYWYDLVNDGSDPANAEHNFGMMRRPVADGPVTVTANAPKPALVAQAVTARMLGAKPYSGSDGLALPARSARYGDTRVLWSTTSATVTITASGPFTTTDAYGRTITRTSPLSLPLGPSPNFVRGPITSVT